MTVDQLLAACDIHQATAQKLAACKSFSCDDEDLDEFFAKDSLAYRKKLLGKTYLVCPKDDPTTIITAFSLSNDSIRITNRLTDEYKEQFLEDAELRDKTMKRFPGVLIGRLGTNINYAGQGYGSAVMDFIKTLFRLDSRTGCRFLIVDAKNSPEALHYYEKNGFKYLIEDEKLEAKYVGIGVGHLPLNTRLMYFDLLNLKVDDDE
jgi:GNAT superfamily N-acetyltransferase